MNSTWTFWSFNCCKYRKHNEYEFLGISISILIITIMFYFVLQFCGEKNAPMIVRRRYLLIHNCKISSNVLYFLETRFAESINSLRQEIEHIST